MHERLLIMLIITNGHVIELEQLWVHECLNELIFGSLVFPPKELMELLVSLFGRVLDSDPAEDIVLFDFYHRYRELALLRNFRFWLGDLNFRLFVNIRYYKRTGDFLGRLLFWRRRLRSFNWFDLLFLFEHRENASTRELNSTRKFES